MAPGDFLAYPSYTGQGLRGRDALGRVEGKR